MKEETIRLNKHLAHTLGISRREADEWIAAGYVTVNGARAALGVSVNPNTDQIMAKNKAITNTPHQYQYILMNKPVGYVCSRRQQGDAPTIYALLPEKYHHLKVAGRLDKDSCGLILLTDDGNTIQKLTHPRFKKEKSYHVRLDALLSEADRRQIEQGVPLEDGISRLQIVKNNEQEEKPHSYTVVMSEGRNRQIRRTFKQLGYTVVHLERRALGAYSLQQLGNKLYLLL